MRLYSYAIALSLAALLGAGMACTPVNSATVPDSTSAAAPVCQTFMPGTIFYCEASGDEDCRRYNQQFCVNLTSCENIDGSHICVSSANAPRLEPLK